MASGTCSDVQDLRMIFGNSTRYYILKQNIFLAVNYNEKNIILNFSVID